MLSIVVPARNEEDNIEAIVERIGRLPFEKETILVNDNSTDSTGKICDELAGRIKVIHRKGSPGIGNALMEGTRAARGDVVVWVMADLSDDLSTIQEFMGKIDEGADIVFGSRYMEGGSSGDLDPFKAFLSSSFTTLARTMYGLRVHDITNSFRAFRREAFGKLELRSGDFSIAPEMALRAHIMGLRLVEVPTTYATRKKGKPKMKVLKTTLKYFILLLSLWPRFIAKRIFS